jgi:peptidoglycan hydrolase-like protein with peptidoglycan-binding domain
METIGYNYLCMLQEEAESTTLLESSSYSSECLTTHVAVLSAVLIALCTGVLPAQAARTLRYDSFGKDVVAFQNQLKGLGCFPADVRSTGYFGTITKRAVERLQRSQGLTVDGVVGRQTYQAIAQSQGCYTSSKPSKRLTRTLRLGDRNQDVRYLQAQLKNWGFPSEPEPPLQISGTFDQATDRAVRQFQQYHEISPDGIVGPQTANLLTQPRLIALLKTLSRDNLSDATQYRLTDDLEAIINLQGNPVENPSFRKLEVSEKTALKKSLLSYLQEMDALQQEIEKKSPGAEKASIYEQCDEAGYSTSEVKDVYQILDLIEVEAPTISKVCYSDAQTGGGGDGRRWISWWQNRRRR